jgi:hypothetical protein
MPDLRCSVDSCVYNQDELCSAGRISVDNKRASDPDATSCNTFVEQSASNSASYEPTPHMSVQCDAIKCKYNSGYMCDASSIQISGESSCNTSSDTLCATFDDKY